jgi:hypothetical protein
MEDLTFCNVITRLLQKSFKATQRPCSLTKNPNNSHRTFLDTTASDSRATAMPAAPAKPAARRVTVLQFGVLFGTGTDVHLEISISFHGVFCIALCALVDMWIKTGADIDTARFRCK